jgi:nucleoside-diphosphate-sugar epimerase
MSAPKVLRVGVTGGDGFLGRHAVEALRAAGHDAVSFSRRGGAGEHTIVCDLLDPQSRKNALRQARCSHLIHLAWLSDPRARLHSPANVDWACASAMLARDFAESGGLRFVFGGSSAQYHWGNDRLSEAAELRAATLYGDAKTAAERLIAAAAPTLGLSFGSARIFFCYGPGEPTGRLVPDLIANLSNGVAAPCTDGLQRRDYLYAGDVGAAISLIAQSDIEGPVNVCSGEAIPVRALITEIASQMGRSGLPQFGAIVRAKDDPATVEGDASRLRSLGFRPKFDLKTGVAETLRRSSSM